MHDDTNKLIHCDLAMFRNQNFNVATIRTSSLYRNQIGWEIWSPITMMPARLVLCVAITNLAA